MKYKLLALDLDGTLTNTKKEITPYTRRTIIKAQQKGVKIILATGRPTYGVAPIAEHLCLREYGGYILSYNGGRIINWQTGKVMYENLLELSVIPFLYNYAKKYGFTIITYHNEFVITENPYDEYVQKLALLNVMTIKKVDNFLSAIDFPVGKCMIVGEPIKLATLENEMHNDLKELLGVYRSEAYFLELVPKGIDKAQALSVLLKELGNKKEELIAIGDGFNDISMIKYAGLGVAMANAQDIVRQNANFITASNEEDGVAAVVEKFILHNC